MDRAVTGAEADHLTNGVLSALQRTAGNRSVQRLLLRRSTTTPLMVVQRGQDEDVAGFDRTVVPTTVHTGQQDKHIKTSKNYINAVKSQKVHKSALLVDAADLIGRFHKGEFTVLAFGTGRNSVLVNFEHDIGEVIEEATGTVLNTTQYGSIRYGASGGVHIIPLNAH